MLLSARRIFAIPLTALAVGISACAGTPPGSSGTPTTLVPPPPCTGTTHNATTSTAGTTAAAGTTTPTELSVGAAMGTSEAVAASTAAAHTLEPTGTGEVAVVVVTDGRPDIVTVAAHGAERAAVELTTDDGTQVVAVDDVVRVGLDSTGAAPIASDPRRIEQWAMDDLAVEEAWAAGTGAGVDIAVIDSGVSAAHRDFDGRVCGGVAFLDDSALPSVGAGAVDGHGHGTHVAGIAAAGANNGIGVVGVAPDTRVIPVRVLANDGTGYSSDVAWGIIWAVDHGAEVINMSLGGAASADIAAAVDYATVQGVVVVASAGNDGPNGPANYPAALPRLVTAVASYGVDRELSTFSTHGSYVDVAAPGYEILSTAPNDSYKRMSGTSMATPHVAGLAAILAQSQPALGPAGVGAKISDTAVDAGPTGHDNGFGNGIIDLVAALVP